MTASFERLSIKDGTILASMLAILAMFTLTTPADATVQNKSEVFEIKNLQTIEIPSVYEISELITSVKSEQEESTSQLETIPAPTPLPAAEIAQVKSQVVMINDGIVPPKKIGDERVYMHEPEIRAYICPKLGEKCNTFIAILKAENGTHECTRDNRGLNRNGSIDIGLTQINWTPQSPYSFEQLQDCKFNLDIAMKKYESRGFQPWAAYNSGRYLKHLPAVLASAAALETAATVDTTVATIN